MRLIAPACMLFAFSEVFAGKTYKIDQKLSIADQCDAVNAKRNSKKKCNQYGRNDGESFKAFKKRKPCKWAGNKCKAVPTGPKPCKKLKKKACKKEKARCLLEKKPYACVDKPTPTEAPTTPAPTTPAPTTPAPTTPAPTTPAPTEAPKLSQEDYKQILVDVGAGTKSYTNIMTNATSLDQARGYCADKGGVLAWADNQAQFAKFTAACQINYVSVGNPFHVNAEWDGTAWYYPSGTMHGSWKPYHTKTYTSKVWQVANYHPIYYPNLDYYGYIALDGLASVCCII